MPQSGSGRPTLHRAAQGGAEVVPLRPADAA
jgi:hypothetical protein